VLGAEADFFSRCCRKHTLPSVTRHCAALLPSPLCWRALYGAVPRTTRWRGITLPVRLRQHQSTLSWPSRTAHRNPARLSTGSLCPPGYEWLPLALYAAPFEFKGAMGLQRKSIRALAGLFW
jgi:hypothetical protein